MKTRKKLMLVVTLIFVMSFVLGNVAYAYNLNSISLSTAYKLFVVGQKTSSSTQSVTNVSNFVGNSDTIWYAKVTDATGSTIGSGSRKGTGYVRSATGTIMQSLQLHMKASITPYKVTGSWTP